MTTDPLARVFPPNTDGRPMLIEPIDREQRVAAIAIVAACLSRGEPAPPALGRFVGRSLAQWLADGGDLARDHLKVAPVRGSRATPSALARRMFEGKPAAPAGTARASFPHRDDSNAAPIGARSAHEQPPDHR
ncbi:MAG: hypothetical protein QM766_27560 [Burkholderiaceae bacterium]